jgi:hypothetical protein
MSIDSATSTRARTGEDVWRQVQEIARTHIDTGEPIYTLTQRVPNWVTRVDEALIYRRSARARSVGDPNNRVSKKMVIAIWDQMVGTGSSLGARERAHGMAFSSAYALVGQLPDPRHRGGHDLYLANPTVALGASSMTHRDASG